jgi:hypothetical protein
MPITASINQGALPSYNEVNETGINVRTLTWTPQRDVKEKKDYTDAVVYKSARNPRLQVQIQGVAIPGSGGALEGIAIVHPGAAVVIANLPDAKVVHGFTAPTSTKVIVDEVSATTGEEEAYSIDVTATFWQYITTFDSDVI